VGTLKAALPSGGYLAIYDSSDVDPGLNDALHKYNESGAAPYRVRRPDQITRYFDGLDLVDPGVVPIQQWRPDHTPFDQPEKLTNFGGVARKVLCRLAPGVRMDLPEIQGSQADWGLGYEQAAPMAVRMLLGTRLRKLRASSAEHSCAWPAEVRQSGQWRRSFIRSRNRMAASSMSACLFRPARVSAASTPQRCTLAKSP
jgi:hypothetical protein